MGATPELDFLLREAVARRIGADLYHEATLISPETVDAVSAVVERLSHKSGHGSLVAGAFGEAMVGDRAVEHRRGL